MVLHPLSDQATAGGEMMVTILTSEHLLPVISLTACAVVFAVAMVFLYIEMRNE
jgi:hypothetical protein